MIPGRPTRRATYASAAILFLGHALAQSSAVLSGLVSDPSGAVIPNASLRFEPRDPLLPAPPPMVSDSAGHYALSLPPGSYDVHVESPGFEPSVRTVTIGAAAVRLDLRLVISTQAEQVEVLPEAGGTSSGENKNALVFSGKQLDTLSGDDATFQQEVLAMAGGTGEGGAEIYVDGFSNGRFPPKDTIREIRINQNPYSAQYDGFGIGRVEILTKPGSNKVHGSFYSSGNPDKLNARNPFTGVQPPYYSLVTRGDLSGPLGKKTSIFGSGNYQDQQTNAVVNAVNPDGQPLSTAVAAPRVTSTFSVRLERQLTTNNTFIARYEYNRINLTNSGVGLLVLASEGVNSSTTNQTLQLGNTQIIGPKIVSETRFQFARIALDQKPVDTSPTIIVQGSFSGGGAPAQASRDVQNNFEFQQYLSLSLGKHFLRTGGRLRIFSDANTSTANYNGQYTFSSLAAYQARTPTLFSLTAGQSSASLLTTDLGLYAEDEWKVAKNVTISYGLRLESQSAVPDHFDPAPRAGVAWAIGQGKSQAPVLTLRANAGIFYQRFMPANLLTSVRQNGVTQQSYLVANPTFYPNLPSPSQLTSTLPTPYTVSPNLRSAYDTIAGVSAERSLGKIGSFSATYLVVRGVHQYNSFNVNAPLPGTGLRPLGTAQNVYQFASEGIEKAQTIFMNTNLHPIKKLDMFAFYVLRQQMSNTFGSTAFPSNPYNLSADYGPSGLGSRAVAQRFFFDANYRLPYGFSTEFFASVQSAQRFNITTGTDLNGDTLYNDRPAFATNPTASSILFNTPLGRFDGNPQPGEQIIPYNYGVGPGIVFTELGLTRDFKFGPRPAGDALAAAPGAAHGPAPKPDPAYSLSFTVDATNLFNHVNGGSPVGVLTSPYFGRSISLNNFFAPSASANRVIYLQTSFHF